MSFQEHVQALQFLYDEVERDRARLQAQVGQTAPKLNMCSQVSPDSVLSERESIHSLAVSTVSNAATDPGPGARRSTGVRFSSMQSPRARGAPRPMCPLPTSCLSEQTSHATAELDGVSLTDLDEPFREEIARKHVFENGVAPSSSERRQLAAVPQPELDIAPAEPPFSSSRLSVQSSLVFSGGCAPITSRGSRVSRHSQAVQEALSYRSQSADEDGREGLCPRMPGWLVGDQVKAGDVSTADILERMILVPMGEPPDKGVFSPVSPVRLSWDAMAAMLLLMEMIVTPLDMVFYGDTQAPEWVSLFGVLSTSFFFIDILLNFNTGFVERERPVMKRWRIFKNYMSGWFWLDLISTIPFDYIQVGNSGGGGGAGFTGFLRFGKGMKVLKNIRYLKVVRAMRMAKNADQASQWMQILAPLKYLFKGVQVLFTLSFTAHFLGCCWALAHGNDADFRSNPPLRRYFESFWWAFVTVGGGASGGPSGDATPSLWAMDIVIVCVRLGLVALGATVCVFQATTFIEDDAHSNSVRSRALAYLRGHKVSFTAQLQILQCINETGKVRKLQKGFDELMSSELPPTVRGMVSEELWACRLMSFTMFKKVAAWDPLFIRELAMTVREEVLASQVIIFKEGDSASHAYYIIKGRIAVGTRSRTTIPDYIDGMWVGEKALYNPLLRRSASVVTRKLTTLMVVSAEEFQHLLSKRGLVDRFHEYCKQNLWKGLCARCGHLGDHWSDDCPAGNPDVMVTHHNTAKTSFGQYTLRWWRTRDVRDVNDRQWKTAVEHDAGSSGKVAGDLKKFLDVQDLAFLAPHLKELGISNLDELESADLDHVNALVGKLPNLDMRQTKILEQRNQVFTEELIQKFRSAGEAQVCVMLYFGKSRSHHLMFLSHYKVEAGTEAALMRSEIETTIEEDPANVGNHFDVPVFLDSEDLRNLDQLRQQVQNSHNVVLLLTKGIFTRPWCLVEVVTAIREGVSLVPVLVTRPGLTAFEFPDDVFYKRMAEGALLDPDAVKLLSSCDIELKEVSKCIKEVFKNIALPYAPHQSAAIRRAQVEAILANCKLKGDDSLGSSMVAP